MKTEFLDWVYVTTFKKWCLHLDKFHKCGTRKTVRFSKRALPPHAKDWPTVSNETAKKFLQEGALIKAVIAPQPEPLPPVASNPDTSSTSSKEGGYDDSFDELIDQLDYSPFVGQSEHFTVSTSPPNLHTELCAALDAGSSLSAFLVNKKSAATAMPQQSNQALKPNANLDTRVPEPMPIGDASKNIANSKAA
jgi:hypothetical protein